MISSAQRGMGQPQGKVGEREERRTRISDVSQEDLDNLFVVDGDTLAGDPAPAALTLPLLLALILRQDLLGLLDEPVPVVAVVPAI